VCSLRKLFQASRLQADATHANFTFTPHSANIRDLIIE
jgi:hypothetical protein